MLSSCLAATMSATIDFQAFDSSDGGFVIKELAIINHHNYEVEFWVFKPPFEEKNLDPHSRRTAQWLKYNHHGLDWNDGNVDFCKLKRLIRAAVLPYHTLYAKGYEKAGYLQGILHRPVIELATLGCPSLYALPCLDYQCFNHYKPDMQCAINNAVRLAYWCNHNGVTDHVQVQPGLVKYPMAA